MISLQEKCSGMAGALAIPQTRDKRGHGPGKRERAHTQTIPSLKRRWNVKNKSPKAHVSFMLQELTNTRPCNKIKQMRRQWQMREGQKIMDSDGSGAYTQGSSTTYLYLANTGEVGHESEV